MPSKIITVNVTARDIKYCRSGQSLECPVRRAISRTSYGKQFNRISVGWHLVNFYLIFGNKYVSGVSVPMPEKAEKFVNAFDRDQPVEPFTFTLEVPDTDAE